MAESSNTGRTVRLMLSCDNCRKKKIRCTGTKPACTSCQRSNTTCNYSPVGPRKKPRRAKADHACKRRASTESNEEDDGVDEEPVASVSHLMLRESRGLETGDPTNTSAQRHPPVMEMLRLQAQISALVDQLRTLTIRVSETSGPSDGAALGDAGFIKGLGGDTGRADGKAPGRGSIAQDEPARHRDAAGPSGNQGEAPGLDVSRDLINHLIGVYFEFGHATETGMHPSELYRDRLQRAQVSEPFLLSTLAVASRFSDDPRVQREPAYLAGYEFFERVTRGRMMDVLERDCVENMLTLNNLAVFAVGLPVANRGWYFSGLAMRMATQMSLQKIDAPGRMPGASMMSGPGLESARRAFWTTLLLEALASFASGEPPPVTSQDIHVAEPFDDPEMLRTDAPNVSAYIAQLAKLLLRVARLNGNRHPESA
ncbi:hypothetical protein IWW50_003117, partial [Coemansia erecta]